MKQFILENLALRFNDLNQELPAEIYRLASMKYLHLYFKSSGCNIATEAGLLNDLIIFHTWFVTLMKLDF